MSTWQITALYVIAGCAVGCLLWICIALEKLAKTLFSIGTALVKINVKIERIEAMNKDIPESPKVEPTPDSAFEDLESALANFEKLKRIDLTKTE